MNGDGLIRWLAGLSLAALALITGIVSYLHALAVVHLTGSSGAVAYLIPFVADFMIVTASLALLEVARNGGRKPPLAILSLVVGIGATVTMNVVAGLQHSTGGALVASLPPVALVLSLETLMGLVRRARSGAAPDDSVAASYGLVAVPDTAEVAAEASLRATLAAGNPWTVNELSQRFSLTRHHATKLRARVLAEANGQHPQEPEGGDFS